MATTEHTLSFMLRNSGDVLHEVEHADVRLSRRDGPDIILVTAEREQAVRDGLHLATRVLGSMLSDSTLEARALVALATAVPWVGWLDDVDQREFARAFVRTVDACRDTGSHGPLVSMLNRWRASAQIVHDPELAGLLTADRGADSPVPVERPGTGA